MVTDPRNPKTSENLCFCYHHNLKVIGNRGQYEMSRKTSYHTEDSKSDNLSVGYYLLDCKTAENISKHITLEYNAPFSRSIFHLLFMLF